MDPREILFCLFLLFLSVAEAIKCKCTKESETVSCYDGVCEMEGGSCLMLDHPSMGQHYTCHTRGLKDGSCRNKTSKSGAPVLICGCDAVDFCNFTYWPPKNRSNSQRAIREEENPTSSTPSSVFHMLSAFLPALLVLR